MALVYQYREAFIAGLDQQFKSEQGQGREADRAQRLMWKSQQAERNEEHARIESGTAPKGNAGGGFESGNVTLTGSQNGGGRLTAEIKNLRNVVCQSVLFTASASDKAGEPLLRTRFQLTALRAREKRKIEWSLPVDNSRVGEFTVRFEQSLESPWPLP